MKSVIHAIRAELADYWDKCFYSQEQRERFSPFYDEDYTETLLKLHDAEVGKMKIHYERHKDLFQAVQKWEENWKLFLELEVLSGQEHGEPWVRVCLCSPGTVLWKELGATGEPGRASAGMRCCVSSTGVFVQGWLLWGLRHVRLRGLGGVSVPLLTTLLYQSKANDPSRFTNRGGNLLKEEKQRAKLQKTLSRLQEDLERKVQTWEEEFKGPFLVKGQQFVEYVSEQWQQYRLEKEKEKQERVSTELSVLAPAWECPWLLPENASLGLSLLGPSHRPGLCRLIPSLEAAALGLVPTAVTSERAEVTLCSGLV
ncbi:hypothetical protein EK904_003801 [Melospiza melodia maxima]|nr:hypothetical protein EK904_003801 [Melospiza melodia maxima]